MNVENLCVLCKGTKKLCGVSPCPKLQKVNAQYNLIPKVGESIFGPSPPNLFIGSYNYPDVQWGPMVSVETDSATAGVNDSPALMYGKPYEEIIRLRSSLVRGKKEIHVKAKDRMLLDAQEAAMSIKTVDMELNFTKKPVFELSFSAVTQPMGAAAPLKDLKVADNARIPKKVDELVSEKGVKATDAVRELFSIGGGFDNYYLTRLLSSGVLGKKDNKKLVPTKWSITAMDDILAKQMMEQIREMPELQSEFLVFTNEYLYNHFEVLLMPGKWEYEGFEAWAPGTIWSQGAKKFALTEEHEPFEGRTTYAEKQVGGYYAARFGVCEGLMNHVKKQGRAVVFREIYEGYMVPVGVWQIREQIRNTFRNTPQRFSNLKEALEDVSSRLRLPLSEYKKQSEVLTQRTLAEF